MKFTLAKEFVYKGYNCYIVNSSGGWRNGYVEIPKDSLFFGKNYTDKLPISKSVLDNEPVGKRNPISIFCYNGEDITMDILFNVHGGITFADDGLGCVDKKDAWFIGFDCNHLGDAKDVSIMDEQGEKFHKEFGNFADDIIRTEEYVEEELKSLVDQIIKYNSLYNNK